MADRITILRGGEVMEAGETARTLSAQQHPYTRQLAQASMHVPARGAPSRAPPARAKPLLEVEGVTRDYPGRRLSLFSRATPVRAVDDVSFSIGAGPVDGAGRPLRLRQVDARPHGPGARPADLGHDPLPAARR